jgi:hypothetical protein
MKTMAATAMAGSKCNNQSRGAVEATMAAATVTGSGNDCNNDNEGSSADGKRAG